jgi:hypothetical protein
MPESSEKENNDKNHMNTIEKAHDEKYTTCIFI